MKWKGVFSSRIAYDDFDKKTPRYKGIPQWTYADVAGPVFPIFLKADMSTYEGFRALINEVGLNGFTYLDESTGYGFPIGRQLAGVVYQIEETPNDLRDSFIEKFYDRVQDPLIEEQNVMRAFHRWFVEGKGHPLDWGSHEVQNVLMAVEGHLSEVTVFPNWRYLQLKERFSGAAGRSPDLLEGEPPLWRGEEPPVFDPKSDRKLILCGLRFQSLTSFCYMEMLDLIRDGKDLRECVECKKTFIPPHGRREFCNRPAPGYQYGMEVVRTCQEVGSSKRYEKENAAYRKEYKFFNKKLSRLKEAGRMEEYEKVFAEFEQFKKRAPSKTKKRRMEK